MYAKINDHRINDNSEKEIFIYSSEEKETNLNFDYKEGVWQVWTSVPNHITKLLKLKNHTFEVESVTETGRITAIKGTLSAKQISFGNILELTEEQREAKAKILRGNK